MNFEKIYKGVADEDKTFELINRGYSPDVFKAGQWFECEEKMYWYFLEVLPPMDFNGAAFSMCEFSTGVLTNAWVKRGGRYYCLTIQRRTADDFTKAMWEFERELRMQPKPEGTAQEKTFAI